MDFATSPPTVNTNANMGSYEGVGVLSDSAGNLRAYCNSERIYDASLQMMQGGGMPNSNYSRSMTQGSLLLPINDSIIYAIFIIVGGSGESRLRYSEINVNRNSGLGEVLSANNVMLNSNTEKMISVRDGSGGGWWIVLHEPFNRTYKKIHIDNQGGWGVSDQIVGGVHMLNGLGSFGGEMVVSASGRFIAFSRDYGAIDLLEFNRCTGNLTLIDSIVKNPTLQNSIYGLSFSPDESLLYVSDGFTSGTSYLYQYDLQASNILASESIVDSLQPLTFNSSFGAHELGPDGKIYITQYSALPDQSYNDSLCVIHNPDLPGLACNFERNAISLLPSKSQLGLPNLPNYRLGPLTPEAEAGPNDSICPGDFVQLGTPDTAANHVFQWIPAVGLSDPSLAQPLASPSQTTTYYLMVTDTTVHADCASAEDSVTVFVIDTTNAPVAHPGVDTIICQGDSIQLGGPPQAGVQYAWMPASGLDDPASSAPLASPLATTIYTLSVWDSLNGQVYACRSDQAVVRIEVEEPFVHELPAPQSFCPGEVLLIGVAAQGGFEYAWSPKAGLQDWTASETKVQPEESILYSLSITDPTLITENCRTQVWPVPLTAEECVLQNALTPNGDGVNDVLHLGEFQGQVSLVVYNRWGKRVFAQDNYQNLWDGGRVPEGVYYYVLKTQEGEKVGHFNLLR